MASSRRGDGVEAMEQTCCRCAGWSGSGRSLAMMAALGFLWGGACFGFNGIKRVLLAEGFLAEACEAVGDEPCAAQLEGVDAAWTFASAMLNVFALVNGSLSDALGLRRLCYLSAALLAAATGAFAVVVSIPGRERFLPYAYFALVESPGGHHASFEMHRAVVGANRGTAAGRDVDIPRAQAPRR